MTILFLCPYFFPHIGGVEKHVFEVAKRLSKKHKVSIITEGEETVSEKIKSIRVYRFYFGEQSWLKKFRIWKTLLNKRKLFEKADVIHCHDVFFWYLPLRLIFPRKKVYTTFHGYEGDFPLSFKAVFIRKLSEKLSKGNICVGEFISKWYGAKPNFVTYGARGKVLSRFQNHRLAPGGRLKIVFLGRIDKDTGVKIYSESLDKLKKYELIVCGDGPLRKDFEKYGKVLGFVSNPEDYIKKTDIVFASSYLSILESMNYKKPVFSVYQNPLKKDYLKLTPFSKWISISSSAKDLTNKIYQYRRDSKFLEDRINKGYNWVRNETWEKVTALYYKLYEI